MISIAIEDPATPEIMALLDDGERYGASLYPAESNHFLSIEALRDAKTRFVVARDGDGAAVGTGAVALYDGWAELKRMWVVPAARGKGLSKALLADLEARASDAGARRMCLETGIHNHEALTLYERAGYLRCEPFGDYRPDPFSVFMAKDIISRG